MKELCQDIAEPVFAVKAQTASPAKIRIFKEIQDHGSGKPRASHKQARWPQIASMAFNHPGLSYGVQPTTQEMDLGKMAEDGRHASGGS
ncbi:uncharacterized protein J3R85_016302 [Psidium guajava]|nr:uncharacterized protein J3R85_016302 [Psidium guajava]